MDNSKRCSKCKTCQPNNNFGNKTNGTEYKTCVKCRTKDKNKNNDTDTNNNSIYELGESFIDIGNQIKNSNETFDD